MQSKEILETVERHIEDGGYVVDSVKFGEVEKSPEATSSHQSLDGPIAKEVATDEYQEIKIIVKRSRFEVKEDREE